MKTTTHDVVVHKAGLVLMKGESLRTFTQKLSEAARKTLGQKLNIDFAATNKNGMTMQGAYMVEAFSDSVIFDVYKYKGDSGPAEYRYFAMKYARKSTGEFDFSYTTEVERVTTYQAKESMVAKSASAPPARTLAPAPSVKQVAKSMPEVVPGWSQTSKSFWDGAPLHVL